MLGAFLRILFDLLVLLPCLESLHQNLCLILLLEEIVKEESCRRRRDLPASDVLIDDGVHCVGVGQRHGVDGQEREVVLLLQEFYYLHRCCCFTSAWHAGDVQ